MRRLVALAAIAIALPRSSVQAQKPAPAIVLVHVTDATGAPLSGAELLLLKGAKEAVLLATSDAAGKHTFSFAPEDAHYQLMVRKVGFVQSARLVPVAPGDTFSIQLALAGLPQGLDTVRIVQDRRALSNNYFLGADEIAASSRYINDVWDAVRKLRPDMIVDKDRCPGEPLKYIWVNGERLPAEDVPTTASAPPPPPVRSGRGGRGGRGGGGGGSGRPPVTAPLASKPAEPGSVLAMIKPEHIAEMRYLNCWDTSMPGIGGNRALFIVLKPGVSFDLTHGSYVDSVTVKHPDLRPPPPERR